MVESVETLAETDDVWCLTVPGIEAFCLENGAVVHNCADALRQLGQTLVAGRVEHANSIGRREPKEHPRLTSRMAGSNW